MTHITQSHIEQLSIECLKALGYQYIYAPDSETPERDSFEQVLLLQRLRNAIRKINPGIRADAQEEAIKAIQRISSPELLSNNETFHRFLTEGIPVSKRVDGDDRGDRVWLIDFKNQQINQFAVANQFTIIDGLEAKAGSISAGFSRYIAWKTAD